MQIGVDLYTGRMNVVRMRALPANIELRELRCLVAVVDTGTFTDAGIDLGMSQAAVSRNIAALEAKLGVRLLRRTTRQIELTTEGATAVATARRALGAVTELVRQAQAGVGTLRLGYAWSALGAHTVTLQRRWAEMYPDTELELVRTNTSTGGIAEGTADLAILRRAHDAPLAPRERIASQLIGTERRFCVMAADDPWARRRSIPLSEMSERTVAIDVRTGSTSVGLWPDAARPRVIDTNDIDNWLTTIASGRAIGMTSEATVHQHQRPGVVYRAVKDAPPIEVHLAWPTVNPHPARDALVALLLELYAPGNGTASRDGVAAGYSVAAAGSKAK
jgi:DNA-binding transcriptional LysR family regulator